MSENKIAFMSFNKSKGIERKIVFVYSVDDLFDIVFGKEEKKIPNLLYVALTRSLEHLIVM